MPSSRFHGRTAGKMPRKQNMGNSAKHCRKYGLSDIAKFVHLEILVE
jgi:hypothetical protein